MHTHDPGERARIERVEIAVLAKNDTHAAFNRGWLAGRGLFAVNLVGSPGAGKTALLERLARDGLALSVIEADLATDRDAERVRAAGAKVVQVNTGTVCHLDAHLLGHALSDLDPPRGSVVVVENVGNLVCPAMFDLGEAARVVVWSVTEGEDKPIKYPHMFASATEVVLSKTDLAPHVPFDLALALDFVRRVNPKAPVFQLSSRSGEGMAAFREHLGTRAKMAGSHP